MLCILGQIGWNNLEVIDGWSSRATTTLSPIRPEFVANNGLETKKACIRSDASP